MKNILNKLYLIPSFYGFTIWIFLILLLPIGILKVNVGIFAYAIYLYVALCFLASVIYCYFNLSKKIIKKINARNELSVIDRFLFWGSTLIGMFGLIKYIDDFSEIIGGYSQFILIFLSDPMVIRGLAEDQTSLGFQLSYFSWISISFCFVVIFKKSSEEQKLNLICLWIILIVQTLLNLFFIDRTRPVIIITTIGLIFILINQNKTKKLLLMMACLAIFPFVFFVAHAFITNKYNQESGIMNELLTYILGGFGYFSAMLDMNKPDYSLLRTFYPVAKVFQQFDSSLIVPSQIPEFYAVPFETNAGTFLEPLYADGGILLVMIGVPLIIGFIDYIAISALKSRSYMGLIVWSHLIVIQLFSFFVPKFNSSHIYLFIFIFLICHTFTYKVRS